MFSDNVSLDNKNSWCPKVSRSLLRQYFCWFWSRYKKQQWMDCDEIFLETFMFPFVMDFFSSSKVWNVVLSGAFLGHDDVTSLLTLHQSCIYRGHKAKQHFFSCFLIIWLLFGPKSKRRRKHRNSLEWCISKSLWLIGLFIFALMRPRCSKVLLLHTFKPGITRTTLPLTDTPSIT